jgi:Leucine-rich repeat (LRR) protein
MPRGTDPPNVDPRIEELHRIARTEPIFTVLSDQALTAAEAHRDSFNLHYNLGPIFDILRHSQTATPLSILADPDLADLMCIVYPGEKTELLQQATPVLSDSESAAIIRDAVARLLQKAEEDVNPADYESVAELVLSNTDVTDLTLLRTFKALTTLSLDGTQVSDLSPLQGLTA